MITQKIAIASQGIIEGGFLQYSADDQSGLIQWQCQITAGLFLFTKDYSYSGTVKVDPSLLKSASWKVGTKVSLGQVSVEVLSIEGDQATCSISVAASDANESGQFGIDLSKPDISILGIEMKGTVQGYDVQIQGQA